MCTSGEYSFGSMASKYFSLYTISVLVFSSFFGIFARNLSYGYISGKYYKTTQKNLSTDSHFFSRHHRRLFFVFNLFRKIFEFTNIFCSCFQLVFPPLFSSLEDQVATTGNIISYLHGVFSLPHFSVPALLPHNPMEKKFKQIFQNEMKEGKGKERMVGYRT